MPFSITSPEDEVLFRAYTGYRDSLRNIMGHGVYPNLVKAIQTLEAFDIALAGPLADEDLIAYHESLMAPVAPYMLQVRGLVENTITIMEALEAAVPGIFGINAQAPEV